VARQLREGDPTAIGDYQLLGRLGAGGMGGVYLGRGSDGGLVAVKVIRPGLAQDAEFLARFRREAEAARRVAAFCTARVLDADLDGPTPHLVTEYIDGPRLDQAIAANGPLDASSLEGFAVGVAAALTAIHGAGLVHRDLKPGNVLLSPYGPRVIDFGIARALEETTLTQTGDVPCTPGWMAPEQLRGGQATAATDVYLWGRLVAYAATGPSSPPDLTRLEGRLRQLVQAALDHDPRRRPTAQALLLGLLGGPQPDPQMAATQMVERTWVRTAHATAAADPGSPWPAPAPPRPRRRRWYRRKRVVVPLLGLILLAIVSSGDTPAAQDPAVGQPARDGGFEFVVDGVTCGHAEIGNRIVSQQAQGQYCLVDVSVTNVGEDAQTLHTGSQRLYDAAGNRYSTEAGAGFFLEDALGGWIAINPGNSVAGTLVYDVPPGMTPAKIELHDSPFSGGVTVTL
jgi:eukaryotic-like serine/threonine-protein kinase